MPKEYSSKAVDPEAHKTFVCKTCQVTISGETSLLQHLWGKSHLGRSGGRGFTGLLPNRWGVVPQLSPGFRRQLASGAPAQEAAAPKERGPGRAAPAPGAPAAPALQKMGLSRESELLLQEALSASAGLAAPPPRPPGAPAARPEPGVVRGREPAEGGGGPAAWRREAAVPPRARGNPRLRATREALPVFQHRAEILDAMEENQVMILEGETGCGKTTQLAQYLLEQAAERREPCMVVCTQPRRISAIGVSERVADERGERIGGVVGYSVRMESKMSSATCLQFCTTGILLRRLENDPDLSGITHVVVDEVHERGVESDFLLLALRDLCRRRQQLKVVLMSATMDKDLFGRYFGGAPSLTVPGRTFPVQTFFLEDALQVTGHALDPTADWCVGGGKGKGKGKGKGDASGACSPEDERKREDLSQPAVSRRYRSFDQRVHSALTRTEQDEVNYDLLAQLLEPGMLERFDSDERPDDECPERPSGVLVFLSGAKEIERVQEELLQTREFQQDPARAWVLPLHGSLPSEDQKKVFERPPAGVRKVVLSTNVAETSVTIDDIGYVIDTGRMKEMRYDAVRRMSSLEDTVVSQTNARQRRGRAGRVAPGLAVHVGMTRHRHDSLLDDHQPPEVRRVPLEQLVLRIHATKLHKGAGGRAASVCARLLEPPAPSSVTKAVEQLVRLGAIALDASGRESLTPLGQHLANLPLEARLGKLVLIGAAFGPSATDAALTVAASLQSRNPFVAPLEKREEANKARRKFADKMAGGPVGPSDHLAVLAAYSEWNALPAHGNEKWDFCQENFLSIRTLQGMAELKRQLLEILSEAGFAPPRIRAKQVAYAGRREDGSDGVALALRPAGEQRLAPCPPALLAALLCAALFPQVAIATAPPVAKAKKEGTQQEKPKFRVRDAESGEPIKVKVHPSSVFSQEIALTSPYFAYQELVSTTQLYVRDVTPIPPLALVLFGGALQKDLVGRETALSVDAWITLAVPPRVQRPLLETRRRLDALLASWVDRGGQGAQSAQLELRRQGGQGLLDAVVQLLSIQDECEPAAAQAPPQKAKFRQDKKQKQKQPQQPQQKLQQKQQKLLNKSKKVLQQLASQKQHQQSKLGKSHQLASAQQKRAAPSSNAYGSFKRAKH